MQIANPIYDTVFKYLLEDNDAAKLLISTIIDEEIVKLDFMPQESILDIEKKTLTVYRLDFKAVIKTKNGTKIVIIEIQKAKFATDIMRFRKYLGEQYIRGENEKIPILSIYFLGYSLEHIQSPVIKVERDYIDVTTGDKIKEREDFIESLTHDSFVIQIKYLKKEHKTEIEQLLSIFDQSTKTNDIHLLNINEEDYPEKFRFLLRRLQKAALEPELRRNMDIEDEIIEELENLERDIANRDKIIEENNKVIEEKNKVIEENKKELEEKDKELEENRKLIEELKKKLGGV